MMLACGRPSKIQPGRTSFALRLTPRSGHRNEEDPRDGEAKFVGFGKEFRMSSWLIGSIRTANGCTIGVTGITNRLLPVTAHACLEVFPQKLLVPCPGEHIRLVPGSPTGGWQAADHRELWLRRSWSGGERGFGGDEKEEIGVFRRAPGTKTDHGNFFIVPFES